MSHPNEHPAWPELTDRQREAVNEVWAEYVIPALEEVATMRRERDKALIAAQDARARVAELEASHG